jgi:membrane protein
VLDRYGGAGGPLLAGGLAYSALFAIVPLLFVATGLSGLLIDGESDRARIVETIANVLPPLRDLVGLILTEAARSAGTISAVGLVTLLWGGSRFLLAFEDAVARLGDGPRRRGAVARNVIGVLAALILVVSVVAGAAITGVVAFLDAAAVTRFGAALSTAARLILELLPLASAILAVLLVYRFVPEVRPSWRAAWRPAWVVGGALTVVARAFVFLAPRLIGAAAAIGALATAFAALAWLGLTFQAILLGQAWVVERGGRGSRPAGPRPAG